MPRFGGAGLVGFVLDLDQPDPRPPFDAAKQPALAALAPPRFRGPREICSCYGNSLRKNKNRPSFATFLRLRTLLRPHKVEMSYQKGRFAAFLDRDPRFGAPRQSAIAKKLQFGPIFCFWVSGGRLKGGAVGWAPLAPERGGRFLLRANSGRGRHARANVGYGSSL